MTALLEELKQMVIEGKAPEASALVQKALEAKMPPTTIIDEALIPAMNVVGGQFETGEYCLPEMMLSARAMQASMKLLDPLLAATGVKPAAVVVLGTVKGDLHDIGKNLVGTIMGGAGFKVVDLGANVSPETFVEAVKTHHANMVGMSAMLTTTLPMMDSTVRALTEAGVRGQVKVLIGGAAANQSYANRIGADGYAADAGVSTKVARALLGLEA
jgi:5-methyltetrahydrofolate--homocysteine methyltransferase